MADEERLNEDGGTAASPQNLEIPESLAAVAAQARKFRKRPILTPQARAHLFYGGRKQRATITVPSVLAGVRPFPPGFLATGPTVLRHPATQDETLKRKTTHQES